MLGRYRWAKEMKTKTQLLEVIAELQNEVIAWKVRFADNCEHTFDLAEELRDLKIIHQALIKHM